ncbi:protocadherin gamma-C5-like isoform X5 [Brienomyrus brachyistius]|uniref:protocadherin gamma-C5-like isoform X5 n=1 Tax=Brienomyrus brachyistius TaxID=42636 RepID=UPI0020B25BA4|nr:protocadherin gamma-C5-like isoform X5 [Brienomyrus brachyistius]
MIQRTRIWFLRWQAQHWLFFCLIWSTIDGQVRYTIPEELDVGSVVGNLVKDLGLSVTDFSDRNLQIASESGKQYFSVGLEKGELVVTGRIDREVVCSQSVSCLLPLEVIIENPLQLYRIDIEIQDINDNAPVFPTKEHILKIGEHVAPGARFPLERAHDPDVSVNTLSTYKISPNEHFVLNVKVNKDGAKLPELVLQKALDREKQPLHQLVLTAIDGGNPTRSGTTAITINVLDNNDNAPQFEKPLYEIPLREDSPTGSVIVTVKAFDLDEGSNADVEYSFSEHTSEAIRKAFIINSETGDITIAAPLDYEEANSYEFDIRAKDKGVMAMEGHCTVQVDITDVNDNFPEVTLKSSPSPVKEDAPLGTVVALISAGDSDSGDNGKVILHVPPESPFALQPSFSDHYALVTNSKLDHETAAQYNIKIIATDSGSPPLTTEKVISIDILDVNDNPPVFSQQLYIAYVKENGNAGSVLCSVSASDSDVGDNAKISYSILDSKVHDVPVSSYVYINSDNGSIYSMHTFDYEKIKVFRIQIQATDHGSASLSSNTTVLIFIVDQNDNAPAVIYPLAAMGSMSTQTLSRSAKPGHLVTKVTAVDADSGHNAWISYKLVEATDASLFSVNLYTGEVRTKRTISELDDSSHRLLIEIKDNGEPIQSTTVTVGISLEDGIHEPVLDFQQRAHEPAKKHGEITFYLIIALASVSAVSLLTFVILTVKCVRNGRRRTCCCMRQGDPDDHKNRNLHIQLNTDGPIKYVEVLGGDMLSQSQSFRSCLSPMSEFSDLTLIKPSSTMDFKEMVNVIDASLPDSAWTFESQQQKPPNTDWRFSQNQRPGPSGCSKLESAELRWTSNKRTRAGVPPEGAVGTGPWPNPPTEAEQLQALMAAANEVSEATATLGPGTMGLSTRYSPQFTLQHVPDYRQNVYIPGSTATLTANPQQQALPPPQAQAPPPTQAEPPKAAQTPASKKKSAKKEKK